MSKKAKVIVLSIISVLVVGALVLVIMEGVSKRKLYLKNNTDKNLTDLMVYFGDTEAGSEDEAKDEETGAFFKLFKGALNAGAKETVTFDAVKFNNFMDDLYMDVTFEGEEAIWVYESGEDSFAGTFDGTIEIEFYQEEGQYRVRMNAYNGLFRNAKNTIINNSELYFDFEMADWYEVGESPDDYIDFSDLELDEDDEGFEDDEDDEDDEEGTVSVSPTEG